MKLERYKPNWELSTIPEDAWKSETARRTNAKRKVKRGWPKGLARKPKQPIDNQHVD